MCIFGAVAAASLEHGGVPKLDAVRIMGDRSSMPARFSSIMVGAWRSSNSLLD